MSAFEFPPDGFEICPAIGKYVPIGRANYTGFKRDVPIPAGGLPYDLPGDYVWNSYFADWMAPDELVEPKPLWVLNKSTDVWQPPLISPWVFNVDTGRYEPPKSVVVAPQAAAPETAIVANETESEEEEAEVDHQGAMHGWPDSQAGAGLGFLLLRDEGF